MVLKGLRLFYPKILALLLLAVSTVPADFAGASAFFPAIDIMVIYYWGSYRPANFSYLFVFLLGILRDSIEGVALGINPFIYLIVRLIVVTCRDLYRKESFIIVWQGFVIVSLISISIKWLILSVIADVPLSFNPAMMQFMFSIAMYPLLNWFFNRVNHTMPEKSYDEE